MQRAFRRQYEQETPCKQSILHWYRQFRVSGCPCKYKTTIQQEVPDESVERVREAFVRSPQESTTRRTSGLGINVGKFCDNA